MGREARHPRPQQSSSKRGMVRRLLLLASLLSAHLWAQAQAGCPLHPATVAAMRDCYRPLIVFAPSARDPRVKQQQAILDSAAGGMRERKLLYLPVFTDSADFAAPLTAPFIVLPAAEQAALRKRFGSRPGDFAVVLLGEDGGAKLRSRAPVTPDRLNSLVDSMPMRQREKRTQHSNGSE